MAVYSVLKIFPNRKIARQSYIPWDVFNFPSFVQIVLLGNTVKLGLFDIEIK